MPDIKADLNYEENNNVYNNNVYNKEAKDNQEPLKTGLKAANKADINEEQYGRRVKSESSKRQKLDTKEIKLKCHIEDKFFARAHFQEFFRRPGTQLVILLAVALLVQSLLAGTFTDPEISLFYKAGIVMVALGTFVLMPLLANGRWSHIKAGNDFWLNDQSFVLNTKGVQAKSKHGDRRLQWREIRRIFETNEAIVFTLYRFHMVVLPLTSFSQDEKHQIREIIRYCTRNLKVKPKLLRK